MFTLFVVCPQQERLCKMLAKDLWYVSNIWWSHRPTCPLLLYLPFQNSPHVINKIELMALREDHGQKHFI